MSNRVYGTEKVDKVIGLNNGKKYEKINIFSERVNSDNLFGIAYYTVYEKGKPIIKYDVIPFYSREMMIEFLRKNFDLYELDHYVLPEHRHIGFHYVDLCSLDYHFHDGKSDKDYISLRYREYANNSFSEGTMTFPKEYENMFVDIVNRSRPKDKQVRFAHDVDVNEQRRMDRHENIRKYTVPMGELIKLSGKKLKHIKDDNKIVGKLKFYIPIALVIALMAEGFVVVINNRFHSEFLEQKNSFRNERDISIYANKGRAGIIIEKLMLGKYDEVMQDDLKFVFSFLRSVDLGNYDDNNSFNSFDYDDYLDFLLLGTENYSESSKLLTDIEEMYKSCFTIVGDSVVINKENANKCIDYLLSLSVTYDAYPQTRPVVYVKDESQSEDSKRATTEQIMTFNRFPAILRDMMLVQVQGLIRNVDYDIGTRPLFYFDGLDNGTLMGKLRAKISETEEEIFRNCGKNYFGKK